MFKKILSLVGICCGITIAQVSSKVVDVSCYFNPLATNYSNKSWNSKMIKTTWSSGEYILFNSDDGEVLIPSQMNIMDYIRIFNDKDKLYPIMESNYRAILLYVNGQRFDIKYDKSNKIEIDYIKGKFVCVVRE